MFLLKRKRDAGDVRRLLMASMVSNIVSQLLFVGLVATGVTLAFKGNWWSWAWPWAAVGVVAVLWSLMGWWGTRAYNPLRKALKSPDGKPEPGWLEAQLRALPALRLTVVGLVGLALIVALMVAKPF
jgi:hypothetical protein